MVRNDSIQQGWCRKARQGPSLFSLGKTLGSTQAAPPLPPAQGLPTTGREGCPASPVSLLLLLPGIYFTLQLSKPEGLSCPPPGSSVFLESLPQAFAC